MPYQKDYILRLIEECFNAIARVLKLKNEQQYQEALELIDETAQSLLKLDLNKLDDDVYFDSMIENKLYNTSQLGIIADLMNVKAEVNYDNGSVFSAINHYEKALALYENIEARSKTWSQEQADRITALKLLLISLKGQ